MALGKVRSTRRPSSSSSSSSTSYTSTITTLVFVALCVVGLWMLTSSSVVSPQTTTTTTTTTARTSNSLSFNTPLKPIRHHKDNSRQYEDNPGDLPDDAVKHDHNLLRQPDKSSLLATSHDPETTATAELGTETGIGEGIRNQEQEQDTDKMSFGKNDDSISVRHEQEQEEHDTQMVDENIAHQTNREAEDLSHEQQTIRETVDLSLSRDEQQQQQQTRYQDTAQENQQENESQSREESQQDQHETLQENQQENESLSRGDSRETEEVENQHQGQQNALQETENQIHDNTQNIENSNHLSHTDLESSEHLQQTQNEGLNDETPHEHFSQQDEDHHSSQPAPDEITTSELNQESQEQETVPEEKHHELESAESALNGAQSGIPRESKESKQAWSTQADQSENQKERKIEKESTRAYTWELCNITAGADYIPCLDNEEALKHIHITGHYEHRERHCPEEGPTCLVALPQGYKRSIEWPSSRDKIWYHNVPHTKLAEVKGHQNWVKVTGEILSFPGGGTQFIHGALHYIDFLQKSQPNIAWGKHTRVVLDVGCGVASFGGFLFDRDVLTMSFAPKDEHEAQVQFALERGIPAISAVMGTQRLPFPAMVFDLVHCARCRVPWHKEGGTLLLELNRLLRPGGYFVWSATPVYQKLQEDVEIWKEMSSLTASMCWELVTIQKDKLNSVGAAIYRKPTSNECYNQRKHNKPPMCKVNDDPNAAWYVPLQACLHKVPVDEVVRGSRWPEDWPTRAHAPPYWLNNSQKGIYGKPAPEDFTADYEHWKQVVTKTYMSGLQISWSNVRNVMDMRAVYGGFAAALKDLKVWVMNTVSVNGPDTLPIIYERGLFGIYHDWCESFSTYPRTYDLLHADHLFSSLKQRCKLLPVIVEVDRIARPGGKFIVRDDPNIISEVKTMLESLHWEIHLTFSKGDEGILSAQKTDWRPESYISSS